MEQQTNEPTFWFTGYLPNGFKCSFTMPVNMDTAFEQAMAFTNMLMAKGFSQHEPGLVAGEQREAVGWVTRRSKLNDDGTKTPLVDVYIDNDKLTYKFISVYLNTPDEIAAFENASGLKIDAMPVWVSAHLERGNPETDSYIVRVSRPFSVITEANQHYNPEEPDIKKRKPKRLFVRWEAANILPLDNSVKNGTQSSQDALFSDLPSINGSVPQTTAEAAKTKLGTPPKQTIAPRDGFTYDRIKMFMEVGKVALDVVTQERNNTIIKMEGEGAFKDITSYQEGVDLVQARLATHREKATG